MSTKHSCRQFTVTKLKTIFETDEVINPTHLQIQSCLPEAHLDQNIALKVSEVSNKPITSLERIPIKKRERSKSELFEDRVNTRPVRLESVKLELEEKNVELSDIDLRMKKVYKQVDYYLQELIGVYVSIKDNKRLDDDAKDRVCELVQFSLIASPSVEDFPLGIDQLLHSDCCLAMNKSEFYQNVSYIGSPSSEERVSCSRAIILKLRERMDKILSEGKENVKVDYKKLSSGIFTIVANKFFVSIPHLEGAQKGGWSLLNEKIDREIQSCSYIDNFTRLCLVSINSNSIEKSCSCCVIC